MGKFYGIGVGVGDSELLTIKAINTLKDLDIIAIPESKKGEGSRAYQIAKEYIKKEVEVISLEFPMIKEREAINNKRKENAEIIRGFVKKGKKVGFLTIGDPMTYSTYIYILEFLRDKISIETIPGITSFASITSKLNLPLVLGDEDLKIISLHKKVDIVKEINNSKNIVFMKVTRSFEKLKEALIITGNDRNFYLVVDCGKKDEKIIRDINDLTRENITYFSTLILKRGE